ncbi:MAG: TrkA family potassium uptake protein [Candidatus Zixiibacteriota bacterium]
MKEFAVIGLGNFGAMVARKLHELGCKITAIDVDKNKVQDLQDHAHQAIAADARERRFLEHIGVDSYDCFIVSTGQDSHASILITLHLNDLNAKRIIVKANSADHSKILYKVGADEVVIPEEDVASKLARSLAQPNLLDFLPLSDEYSIAEIAPPPRFYGKSLTDLNLRSEFRLEVIAIKDVLTGDFQFIPGPSFKIKDTDILVVLGRQVDIERIRG